ncbi:MAG: hypothetical protein RL653_2960 [Pseudomonadota bacterium]|jgi:uncharacterized protein YbjT (DUF2867 family)
MRTVITGASGFIGAKVLTALSEQPGERVAVSRRPLGNLPPSVRWKGADLFSARSTADVLEGADTAVYLVHSMMPSTRLFQGNFHDTDLLLADNFARGCVAAGVRRIVYLGGLVPTGHISPHLESRLEVGEVLRSTGIPVTELRAGMIVGPGGSSFEILKTLVDRLPLMILPEWTQRRTQAVHVDDVVRVIAAAADGSAFEGRTLDVVTGESLTYEKLLRQMAEVLGLRRWMVPVPIRSTAFSKRWVTLFGGASYELVSPLIDSLLCDLPASDPDALVRPNIRYPTFRAMATETLAHARAPAPPRVKRRSGGANTVRSIQRLPSLPGHDCRWISSEYMKWLPVLFRTLIRVHSVPETGSVSFVFAPLRLPLLMLQYVDGKAGDRTKFHIVGGMLSRTSDTGWLEFRQVQHRRYTLAAIHEFVPSLPWALYLLTQAPLHAWVMGRFGKHLSRELPPGLEGAA